LTPKSGLYVTAESTPASACGVHDGIITIEVGNGTPEYQYSTDGENFYDIPANDIIGEDFAQGTHTIWVKDATDCVASTTATVAVNEGDGLDVDFTITPAACDKDGILMIMVNNGVAPYSFLFAGESWIEMNSNPDSISVNAGTHTITIKDDEDCEITKTFEVGNISNISATIDEIHDVGCQGERQGSFTFTVIGGVIPISYSLDAGLFTGTILEDRTITIEGLQAKTHLLEITGYNGCSVTIDNITIGVDNDLLIIKTKNTTVCDGDVVDLNSLITEELNVVYKKFFSDSECSIELTGTDLEVTETGWFWVRAYNQ
jgi:hypothetical protein